MSEAAKKKRTISQRKFSRIYNALNETLLKGDLVSPATLADQMKDLEGAYCELSTATDELMAVLDDGDDEVKQSDAKLSDSYKNLCLIRDKIHKLKAKEASGSEPSSDVSNPTYGILSDIMYAQQNLPRPAIKEFNGEPENYMHFITNFECHVASHCKDDKAKLSYLIQLCGPNAKSLIDHYVMEDNGFEKAKKRLKEKYGQPHLIADALVANCLKVKPIRENDHDSLNKFSMLLDKCYVNLAKLKKLSDIDNQETLRRLTRKLPDSMRTRWVKKVSDIINNDKKNPVFLDLKTFINEQCKIYDNAFGRDLLVKQRFVDKPKEQLHNISTSEKDTNSQAGDARGKSKKLSCYKCSKPHRIHECAEFLSMKFDDKRKFLRDTNRCQNCFMKHFGKCKHASKCKGVNCQFEQVYPHHGIVCGKNDDQSTGQMGSVTNVQQETEVKTAVESNVNNVETEHHKNGHIKGKGGMALRTVKVKVPKANGDMIETYALLDDGSTASFIENDLYDKLGYDSSYGSFHLDTMGQSMEVQGRKLAIRIYSQNEQANVYVNRIWTCNQLPATAENIFSSRDAQNWDHLKNIRFPVVSGQEKVQVLIGANAPEAHWKLEEVRGKVKQPYAVRTILGWTCLGPKIGDASGTRETEVSLNCVHCDYGDTCRNVKQLFETDFPEKIYDSKLSPSQDDIRADDMVTNSIKLFDGKYHVGFPWKTSPYLLPKNRNLAKARLNLLTKRMKNDPLFRTKFTETMADYIDKGFLEHVPENELYGSPIDHYIPLHGVSHPRKDKLRIVFDAAAKYPDKSGNPVCINDHLYDGPNDMNSLVGVLLRFKKENVPLVADIEGMYHMVKIYPEHERNALRVLWFENGDIDSEPVTLRATVHVFGVKSSGFVARKALKQTGIDNKDLFDAKVIEVLEDSFYVDDCLASFSDETTAVDMAQNLTDLCSKGGFKLHKFDSSSRKVLDSLNNDKVESKNILDSKSTHLLGMEWDREKDSFKFSVQDDIFEKPTRRNILSFLAKIYDPLGIISPVLLDIKCILQHCCTEKMGWDDEIDSPLSDEIHQWISKLEELEKISVSRCMKPPGFGSVKNAQLHTFCDASEKGYCAVTYIRLTNEKEEVHVSFLMGKSRVAPAKKQTLPRMELAAAALGAKLHDMVSTELKLKTDESHYWCDSKIVLAYISNESKRFQTYVANRVAVIRDLTDINCWRYIPGTINVSDIGTRGCDPDDHKKIELWLKGPDFLWESAENWPMKSEVGGENSQVEEVKTEICNAMISNDKDVNKEYDFLTEVTSRYSGWFKMKKSVAWLARFAKYCQNKYLKGKPVDVKCGKLSLGELREAEEIIVRHVQKQQEIVNESDQPSARLASLSPFVTNGTCRVGGRLENADMSYGQKHPIILPKHNHVTRVIVRDCHETYGHINATQTLAMIRKKWWVINGMQSVKSVIKKCAHCIEENARPMNQFMASLPANRVKRSRVFQFCGIDYFGPFEVKIGRSIHKRYAVIFSCCVTRAVHFEIAHSLDTSSFLSCLTRFMARRGKIDVCYCDNATNLRSGATELIVNLQELNQSKIHEFCIQRDIEWNFSPPSGSHFGGHYERLIRSARRALRGLSRERVYTDEILSTLFTLVEQIMNSRPLTSVTDCVDDLEPLTPNMILLLQPNLPLPMAATDVNTEFARKWWKKCQSCADQFWKRFQSEYFVLLQTRQKWLKPQRNLKVNDLVLMMGESMPRGKWPLGRIIEAIPSSDGLVRRVRVKTETGVKERPINKLCLLELED